jgi:peptidyl-dipeptidase A
MHELGHAVYDQHIDRQLPFLLREAAHSITTEGIAMMLGSMVKNPDFLTQIVKLDPAQAVKITAAAEQALRIEKLVFSRWAQVMMRFEQSLYVQPYQDLAAKWWELKQRYQLMNPPDDPSLPGFAAKVHVLTAPVYYHSYMMGDLFAAQVQAHLAGEVLDEKDLARTSFAKRPKAGQWLKQAIFAQGSRYRWDELIERATGEPLNPRYFVERYVAEP